MDNLVERLAELRHAVDSGVSAALDALALATDDDLVTVLRTAGDLARRIEGLLVEAVVQVQSRSDSTDHQARLTTAFGCRSVAELMQRTTRASATTAARWERAARAVRPGSALDGAPTPCFLPATRTALLAGGVGVDHVVAIAGALAPLQRTVARDALDAADEELAASATGEPADTTRLQARVWATVLDQDGTEPEDRRAMHRRSLLLGREDHGLVPVRGMLMTEVAAQLQRVFDSVNAPAAQPGGVRFTEAGGPGGDGGPGCAGGPGDPDDIRRHPPVDPRRRAQVQHDALATALGAAARSGELPTIGGAAPTLIVHVAAADLTAGVGAAFTDSGGPLPLGAARHSACAGVMQRVALDPGGRIIRIGTEERVFNRYQRRAIALRDGGCIIPGCGVPPGWCEIHHVVDHARGGPTHTDNGVLLCWFHHRFLDGSGWSIRMNRGVPEVRAPSWNDATRAWRAVTSSPTRMRERLIQRT